MSETRVHATGTFDIVRWNDAVYAEPEGATLSRVEMGKAFKGDLEGTSEGTLLTAATEIGPAAYVGLEHVSGSLRGRRGSFLLQHHVDADAGRALATIVPGSGTGELRGLRGEVLITIEEGGLHRWTLDYEIRPPS